MADGVKLNPGRVKALDPTATVEMGEKVSAEDLAKLGKAAMDTITGADPAVEKAAVRVLDSETSEVLLDTLSEASEGDLMDVLQRALDNQDS